jgi:hypothetical protein
MNLSIYRPIEIKKKENNGLSGTIGRDGSGTAVMFKRPAVPLGSLGSFLAIWLTRVIRTALPLAVSPPSPPQIKVGVAVIPCATGMPVVQWTVNMLRRTCRPFQF